MALTFPWIMFSISAFAIMLMHGFQKFIQKVEENPGRISDQFRQNLLEAEEKLYQHKFMCVVFMLAGLFWGLQDFLLS